MSEGACKIVAESLNYCHDHKGLRTNAYVIMPTHLHGIFFHVKFDRAELEKVLTDFRKFTGRRLADYCEAHAPGCFGHTLREAAGGHRERRLWQPTRHPEQIEGESFWQCKLDYLHANPVRKGLVHRADHWRFSSAGYWMSEGVTQNDVVLSAFEW